MPSYILSHAAENDIEETINYFCEENTRAAYEFVDSLYSSFEQLVEHPYMGHTRKDLTEQPVLFWTFKWHYSIIYKPANPLEIVRVLSGFRDITNLL